MTRDTRYLVMWLCLIGACSDEGEPVVTIDGPPLPGMTAAGYSRAPWARPYDIPPSCLTRYDFEEGPDAECHTEFVDGDPHHWLTTCPDHQRLKAAGIGRELEKQLTEDGDPLLERWLTLGTSATGAVLEIGGTDRYTYDDEGRLSLIEFDFDSDGDIDARKIITDHDADGRPLAATVDGPLVYSPGDELPAVEEHETWGYDDHGRLTSNQTVLAADGTVITDLSITYDDRARRRGWNIIFAGPSPYGPAALVEGYELFDEANRLVTHNWIPDGSEIGWNFQYRYDDDGVLLTTIADLSVDHDQDRLRYVAREVYDCP